MATLKKVGVGSLLFSPDILLMFVLMSRGLKEDYGSRL